MRTERAALLLLTAFAVLGSSPAHSTEENLPLTVKDIADIEGIHHWKLANSGGHNLVEIVLHHRAAPDKPWEELRVLRHWILPRDQNLPLVIATTGRRVVVKVGSTISGSTLPEHYAPSAHFGPLASVDGITVFSGVPTGGDVPRGRSDYVQLLEVRLVKLNVKVNPSP